MADADDHPPPTASLNGDVADNGGASRFSIRDRFAPGVLTRLQYASYLFMGLVTCMILKGAGGRIFDNVAILKEGCEYLHSMTYPGIDFVQRRLSTACFENTMVYRVSFSLACFFFVQFISVSDLTCCIDADSRVKMQERFFCVKTALVSLLTTLSFWIPNSFFATYAWICMFVSAIFLILQIILIVDFSYEWNETWGERSEGNAKWSWYLLGIALLTYVVGVAVTVINYVYFVPHEDCNLHAFVVTAVLVGAVVYTTVAIWVPHGSIVPSGIVFAYTAVITFSALHVSPDARCNRLYAPEQETSWRVMIATAIFSGCALAYSVVSSGGSSGRSRLSLRDADEIAAEDPDESGHLGHYCYFHGIMIMGSMYLAMMVTNWSVSGASGSNGANSGVAVAFWVKNTTVWLTIATYLWTLLAPYFCCRDRDYGYDIPDDW